MGTWHRPRHRGADLHDPQRARALRARFSLDPRTAPLEKQYPTQADAILARIVHNSVKIELVGQGGRQISSLQSRLMEGHSVIPQQARNSVLENHPLIHGARRKALRLVDFALTKLSGLRAVFGAAAKILASAVTNLTSKCSASETNSAS